MKINDRLRFPHPVLAPFTDDFVASQITFEIDVEEVPATSALSMTCKLLVDNSALSSLIARGAIDPFANVVCLNTYFNEFYELSMDSTVIEIAPGLLRGLTQVRPILVTASELDVTEWPDIHAEFGKDARRIPRSSVIGLGEEFRLDVGLDKLRPMESIFRLAKQDSLPEGEIAVDVDGQCIRINASPDLYATINALRHVPATRDVLLNSVYLAASLEVLSLIHEDSSSLEDKWWFRVFTARCTQLGIDPESGDILNDAQALLNSPLGRLHKLQEVME